MTHTPSINVYTVAEAILDPDRHVVLSTLDRREAEHQCVNANYRRSSIRPWGYQVYVQSVALDLEHTI